MVGPDSLTGPLRQPVVTAVFLSHNALSSLRRALEAVRAQTYPVSQLVIVDNGSRDATPDYCRQTLPEANLVLLPDNLGIGAGHNLGWSLALSDPSCELVWALEHDTIAEPECLRTLVTAYLERVAHHSIGAVYPIQLPDRHEYGPSTYIIGSPGVRRPRRSEPTDSPTWSRGFTFNGCLLPRETLARVGTLNEAFFIGHEDHEYAARILRAGLSILRVPAATVRHDAYRAHRPLRLLKWTLLIPGADVIRSYYFNRNALYRETLCGHGAVVTIRALLRLGAAIAYTLLFRDSKPRRLAAQLTATRDGLRGRLGRQSYWFLAPSDAVPVAPAPSGTPRRGD